VSGRRGARARPRFPGLAVNALALVAGLTELSFDAAAQAQVPPDVAAAAKVAPAADTHNVNSSIVALDSSGCPAVSEGELRRLVALELGDLLAPASTPATSAPMGRPSPARNGLALTVACGGGQATLRAHTADRAQALQRTINLVDFPAGAAPRGLALAGIELLATLDASVRERVGESRPPPATPAARASVSLALVGLRRQFMGAAGLGAWGGRLDVIVDRRRLRLDGDLEAAATGTTETIVGLGQARALLGSVGAFAGARFAPAAHLTCSLAAGARFGVARLDGVPDTGSGAVGSAAWRPWGGLALSARGTVGGPRLSGVVSLEIGYTALGAEALAATMTVLALRGPWLTVAAGAAF